MILICWVSVLTISWLLSSICCLIATIEFVVSVGIAREPNHIPNWSFMDQPGLHMDDPDVNIGEYSFTTLSANVEGLVCRFAIIDVGIP